MKTDTGTIEEPDNCEEQYLHYVCERPAALTISKYKFYMIQFYLRFSYDTGGRLLNIKRGRCSTLLPRGTCKLQILVSLTSLELKAIFGPTQVELCAKEMTEEEEEVKKTSTVQTSNFLCTELDTYDTSSMVVSVVDLQLIGLNSFSPCLLTRIIICGN